MTVSEYVLFKKQVKDSIVKARREAKVNTIWINPNANYENIVMGFIEAILNDTRNNKFLKEFQTFKKRYPITASTTHSCKHF